MRPKYPTENQYDTAAQLSVHDIHTQAHLSFVSRAYDYVEGVNVARAQTDYIQFRLMERLGVAAPFSGRNALLQAYQALAKDDMLTDSQIISRYMHDVTELDRVTDEAVDAFFPHVRPALVHQPISVDRRRDARVA